MATKPNKKPAGQQPVQNNRSIPETSPKSAAALPAQPADLWSFRNLCILIGLVSFVVYFNTIWNGFVMDDVMVLKDNRMVLRGTSAIPELLSTPHMRGYLIIPNDLYRPLSLVMFAIEYQFFGLSPAVHHFFNILTFVGCSVMLFIVLHSCSTAKRWQWPLWQRSFSPCIPCIPR